MSAVISFTLAIKQKPEKSNEIEASETMKY
jgi:hypothetical protein